MRRKTKISQCNSIFKNPVILLLEKVNSALDKESEINVQKSIYEIQKGRTRIVVARRLNNIINSEIIFDIESVKIFEQGKHDELMQLGKKYVKLYNYSISN